MLEWEQTRSNHLRFAYWLEHSKTTCIHHWNPTKFSSQKGNHFEENQQKIDENRWWKNGWSHTCPDGWLLRTEPAKQSLLLSVFAVDLSRSPKPILGAVLTKFLRHKTQHLTTNPVLVLTDGWLPRSQGKGSLDPPSRTHFDCSCCWRQPGPETGSVVLQFAQQQD